MRRSAIEGSAGLVPLRRRLTDTSSQEVVALAGDLALRSRLLGACAELRDNRDKARRAARQRGLAMGSFKPLAVVMVAAAGLLPVALWGAPKPVKPALSATYADPAQPDISGLWVVTGAMQYSPDRSVPKLKGEYQALYDKRTQAFKAGIAVDDATANCLPAGLPHLFIVPYPFEVMQTPGRVTFLYEYDSAVRRVPLGVATPTQWDTDMATYNGESYGHWEGDILVIETVNLRGDTQLDFTGLPHSDALRITERMRRRDPNTLEDQITLTDSKAYSEPYSVTRLYRTRPKWKISEYVCEENNRNKPDEQGHTRSGVADKAKAE